MPAWPESVFLTQSISFYRQHFQELDLPPPSMLEGRFQAQFIGPDWLVWLAPRLLPLGGLAGWYGKCFSGSDKAINVLRSGSELVTAVPMRRTVERSMFGQGRALVLTYDQRAPIPLRTLRDEFRALDANTLLGLTVADLPFLRKLALPFILKRDV